jgi:ATP-dependent helicase HrpA
LGQGRDIAALIEQHGGRAREIVRQAAPPADWERSEVTAWDFGDLPPFVTRTILGGKLRAYPALVDEGKHAALKVLEAEGAAQAAHRAGVRRLLMLAAKSPLGVLAKRAPQPFTRRLGLPAPRAEAEAFRELVLARVVTEAFRLDGDAELPRTKAQFEQLLAGGLPRLGPVFEATTRAIAAATAELDKTLRSLDAAAKQPSGAGAVADIRQQLEQLFPQDLLLHVSVARLEHYPRYLRAAQARLTRAINDPRKDASKAEPFTPLWQAFLAKRGAVKDALGARQLHFLLEELRVALFAPELKPAQPVSVASATQALSALR